MNTSTLKDNIFVFNPSDSNADIVRTWDQMKQYGTKQFFTEEDYITAWSKVTSGDALQQLHNMIHSKYSLTKILKFWEELYSKTRSITDQQEIIDSFRRKKKEALVAAMLRVTVDIDQMEYAEDPAAWNGIRDKQRRDVLMKIILPETFSYLRSRREAHEKNGYLLKVDEMIQEAHTFEQSYNYVPQKDYPEHAHIPSANNSIMPILSWNPRGNFQNKPQPMEVDQPTHQTVQRFTQPPPPIVINPQQQQQQRGRTTSKQPFDKNRRQSQQSRSRSNGSTSRPSSASRPQSQSPTRNKYDKNNRGPSKENKYQDQKRSASNSSQHRRQQQGEQPNGPPLPSKGHISSEAGKQAINLNIGDQNQFYPSAATRYCQKKHIWPINMTTPKFCPEYVANQKN
jgi:hypothetical protein